MVALAHPVKYKSCERKWSKNIDHIAYSLRRTESLKPVAQRHCKRSMAVRLRIPPLSSASVCELVAGFVLKKLNAHGGTAARAAMSGTLGSTLRAATIERRMRTLLALKIVW